MKRIPDDYTDLDESFCSNFDHVINVKIAKELMAGGCWAGYPAWEWYGRVWYENGEFLCMVMRYGVHACTVSAPTPEELKEELCDNWGAE